MCVVCCQLSSCHPADARGVACGVACVWRLRCVRVRATAGGPQSPTPPAAWRSGCTGQQGGAAAVHPARSLLPCATMCNSGCQLALARAASQQRELSTDDAARLSKRPSRSLGLAELASLVSRLSTLECVVCLSCLERCRVSKPLVSRHSTSLNLVYYPRRVDRRALCASRVFLIFELFEV